MLFNSIDFAIFIPVVFALYWFVANRNLKLQNLLIVASSYLFYGWWDWKFLILIIISTFIDYLAGLGIKKEVNNEKRKIFLALSITANLGFLAFFKYFNFFIDNFNSAFSFFGTSFSVNSLKIILPIGISFYTFQTLSYTIDVYRKKLEPTTDFIAFSAFVCFFPQLVAGPIERASNLLPQFYKSRVFDYSKAVDGMRQILWGLFKKIVIADNCAKFVNIIFQDHQQMSGNTLFIGVVFFSFQIYCDFSGYSDIAIGVSRLFGFNLKKNFDFPLFSRNMGEFWRRWHISLTTWFKDYLYIPLGGSKGGVWMKIRNTFIIFIVSGFWHGASWTFIVWGAINAFYFLPLIITNSNRNYLEIVAKGKLYPSFKEFGQILLTYFLSLLAWVFFRSESLNHAYKIIGRIFSKSLFQYDIPNFNKVIHHDTMFILLSIFILIEWIGRESEFAIEKIGLKWHSFFRIIFYYAIILSLFYYAGEKEQFIYFQF